MKLYLPEDDRSPVEGELEPPPVVSRFVRLRKRLEQLRPWFSSYVGRRDRWGFLFRMSVGTSFGVLLLGTVLWLSVVPKLDQNLAALEDWRPPTTVQVLNRWDQVVDSFSIVRRVWIPLHELPEHVAQAVVSAEDRRFHRHLGVDASGLLRALFVNLKAGTYREGGSTITQQLVKNTLVGSARTLDRKVWEALLALRLERNMGKHRILELYLNLIYFGSGNYGIEAASMDYFGHSARELTPAESALLAGLIPAPSLSNPFRSQERALERRNYVLRAMEDEGYLSPTELANALVQTYSPPAPQPERVRGARGYLTEVRRQVRQLLGDQRPFEAGLTVHTCLDEPLQASAEDAVRQAVAGVEERQGRRVAPLGELPETCATASVDYEGRLRFVEAPQELPPESWPTVTAVQPGQRVPIEDWKQRLFIPDHPKGARGVALSAWLDPGRRFPVCPTPKGTWEVLTFSDVEAAAVVLEYRTGKVRALVGGKAMPLEGFNRATQAVRQAGSAFKPLVYGTAFDEGRSQLDIIEDGPLEFSGGDRGLWAPRNASRGYWGPVALRWSFTYSLNTPAVRLAAELGTSAIIRRARLSGIQTPLRHDLTLALGSSEVRPIELAGALAGIVRGGVAIEPSLIERMIDRDGRTLAQAGELIAWPEPNRPLGGPGLGRADEVEPICFIERAACRLTGGEGERFLQPGSAWEVVDLLVSTLRKGTGRAAFVEGRDRGGKTGSTSEYRDAWFIGFDGAYIVVVWVGQDDGVPLGPGESGAVAALPSWKMIADDLPPSLAPVPPAEIIRLPFGGTWVDVSADNVPARHLPIDDVSTATPLPIPVDLILPEQTAARAW